MYLVEQHDSLGQFSFLYNIHLLKGEKVVRVGRFWGLSYNLNAAGAVVVNLFPFFRGFVRRRQTTYKIDYIVVARRHHKSMPGACKVWWLPNYMNDQ